MPSTDSLNIKIAVLKGDGIGPSIVDEAIKVLKFVENNYFTNYNYKLELNEQDFGGISIDNHGVPLTEEALKVCQTSDAVLLGAIGGPQWPKPNLDGSAGLRPEQGLLDLRRKLNLYANLRPLFFPSKGLVNLSPLKPELIQDCNFVIVRELTGGIYFGERQETKDGLAYDTCPYTVEEVERIARVAGQLCISQNPPLNLHSVDKANVLATSRLWRSTVNRIFAAEFPTVKVSHYLVDSAAMLLIQNPKVFNGVVLTENLFGDILSDAASVIVGSLGLMPSASLNSLPKIGQKAFGMYEPIHGSAPDLTGKNVANPVGTILSLAMLLRYSLGMEHEANLVEKAVQMVLDATDVNGFNVRTRDLKGDASTDQLGDKVIEALHILKYQSTIPTSIASTAQRRPMNICEKILLNSAIGLSAPGNINVGDMICVKVDWTLASELTWKGMNKTYETMGRPTIHRKDRFWLAIDHTVDPRINHLPKPKELIRASESFAKEADLVDFHGPNQTILHTEFYRQRAQPGMVICGADSHSCSAGGLGAFAVGLGAADVVMPLVTGETWFKVPEVCNVKFINQPSFGIGGKDAILYVLGQLKRNTVAFERAVEFTGPGLQYLSCDARFAIANMTTEFGGIAGVFEPDAITAAYLANRKSPQHRSNAKYFQADPDAQYAESHTIDLSQVQPLIALYPSPDNVKPVSECSGMKLDGCFIGACTTAEEDLILAGLVLEQGLKLGYQPVQGKRRVTPGSVPIVAKLRKLGLIEVYEKAGFEIGAPGCSYCIAVAADHADEEEIWLSSQNRNFKNRMGKGSIANLASAATVAASSFNMSVTDPTPLIDMIDKEKYREMLDEWLSKTMPFQIEEPNPIFADSNTNSKGESGDSDSNDEEIGFNQLIEGKAQLFGDHIDTDAIIPAQFMPGTSDADLGTHAFQYFKSDFVEKVQQGMDIVVGGVGFGSGSSREEAPRALKGAGVKVVIAKSFAFIYSRNQPNMALLGITLPDPKFYELVKEGTSIKVDVPNRTVEVAGSKFTFQLSEMEEKLMAGGGVSNLYAKFGANLFRALMGPPKTNKNKRSKELKSCPSEVSNEILAW